MATERGADWRIEVKGTGDDYDPIGGEISFDWSRSSNEIDESTKDDGQYGSTSYGQQKISFRVNGNVKLPDPGLSAISAVSKASPPETIIRVTKGSIVKYEGAVAVGNFSSTHPKDGPVTYSFDMANKGAPTVDNFAATA